MQSFGHDLRTARDHLSRYELHGDQTEIQQAWDIYYSVSHYHRMEKSEIDDTDLPKIGQATQVAQCH